MTTAGTSRPEDTSRPARLWQVVFRTAADPGPALGSVVLLALATVPLTTTALDEDDAQTLGPPPAYTQLIEARLEPAGHIRNGRLRIDRFEFELSRGDLYLLAPVENQVVVAVYLGDGLVRCYPPDGVEHQQLEKLLDEDYLEEEFDRFVFWFTDDTADRLRDLADDTAGREARKANNLLEDRREELLDGLAQNPDSRLLVDLLSPSLDTDDLPRPSYFHAQIDGDDHGWFSIEIEPREREEVTVYRFDTRRRIPNVWMGFHALTDFDEAAATRAFEGFPRDPEVEGGVGDDDDDDWDARDLGLSPRPVRPQHEGWSERVTVPKVDIDLALEGDGDARASVALLIEPHEPLSVFRLTVSPVLEITDARWRTTVPEDIDDPRATILLRPGEPSGNEDEVPDPSDPATLTGEPVHWVQEADEKLLAEDRYEPFVTIALPRTVARGERFILELSYEGELLERLRATQEFLLKDTLFWIPTHSDNRRSRMRMTFRMPERYRVASGTALVDEHVVDDTRIMRWISDDLVRFMSFSFGRFEVTVLNEDGLPPISIYASKNHVGFAPGNREDTIENLIGAIRTFGEYFGPYPFSSLRVTETPAYSGQAFLGLILLSFQAFGELHSGEAELFRSHEVAHQWWGATVDWETYRDQWLSEGFAQYSAALFTLSGLKDEDKFLDMLHAWRLDVLGQVNVAQGLGMQHYGFRPAVIRESDGNESGPVVVGYRLRTSDTPMDYRLLVYEKGAFILHMIRMMLMNLETGDDGRFRTLMSRFADAHRQQPASTRAFEAAVTRAFGEPMDWFFDQWVYGVDVPTYRPDLEVSPVIGQELPYLLHGTVRREDVPDDFQMPVPIALRFDDHPPIVRRIWIDADTVEVEIPLPAEPADIEFNYHYGVLANVR